MSRIFMHTFVGFKRKRISKYRFDESLCVKVGDQKVKKIQNFYNISICIPMKKHIFCSTIRFSKRNTFWQSTICRIHTY